MLDLFNLKGLLLVVLVFVPLERLLPLHPEQKVLRRFWLNDVVYVFVNGLFIRLGLFVAIVAIMAASDAVLPAEFKAWVREAPIWLQVVVLLFLADLGFYLTHRAFHALPVLWRFHAIHHSIEEMDWLAAHRVHPVDQILTKAASYVPCFALGFHEYAIAAYVALYQWQSLLVHSNTRIKFGPLRYVLASPEFHHWHHGNQPEAYDKNFAGQLPFWDWLFGTLHMPRGRMPEKYGVDDPVPDNYVAQLAYPFTRPQKAAGDAPAPEQRIAPPREGAPEPG